MSTETEIKVKIADAEDFVRQLEVLNPETLSLRHFEDNYLLDFPDERLRSGRCLIRVRYAEGKSLLTFKGPPAAEGLFKTREELETAVDDGEVLCRIFKKLSLRTWFRYQKYRREFRLDQVVVAVDETPVGSYAEFEGSEEGIHALARKLGIDHSRFLKDSYYSIYLQHCRRHGAAPEHMVFQIPT